MEEDAAAAAAGFDGSTWGALDLKDTAGALHAGAHYSEESRCRRRQRKLSPYVGFREQLGLPLQGPVAAEALHAALLKCLSPDSGGGLFTTWTGNDD